MSARDSRLRTDTRAASADSGRVTSVQRRVSVAPMMAYTDRHFRYLLRLVSPTTLLYTEMITAHAIAYGPAERLLAFDTSEHPVALQLGGSDPRLLAGAASAGARAGFDEINLNVGCPSERVQSGSFGACLMAEPGLVAECLHAMIDAVPGDVPVTVKCRIGIDDQDDYEFFERFVTVVAGSGVRVFIVHARKAVLSGLSPRENREIPPLRYEVPQRLRRERPDLAVVLNGGLRSVAQAQEWLAHFDGVMFGRQVCEDPWLLADLDSALVPGAVRPTRAEVVARYADYVDARLSEGHRPATLLRHAQTLFGGFPGSRAWRRVLSDRIARGAADGGVLRSALPALQALGPADGAGSDPRQNVRTGT
jgi:tRNA-dihydrouridine synthase A